MIKGDHSRSWSTLPATGVEHLGLLVLDHSLCALPGSDDQLHSAGLHEQRAAAREGLAKESVAHVRAPAAPGQPPHQLIRAGLLLELLLGWKASGPDAAGQVLLLGVNQGRPFQRLSFSSPT